MRKIETAMNNAIQGDTNWSQANTSVTHENGTAFVYLHGNKIAEVDDVSVTVFDGGWQTTTTKSRLNAILSEFGSVGDRVYQDKFVWFVCDNGQVAKFDNGYTFA